MNTLTFIFAKADHFRMYLILLKDEYSSLNMRDIFLGNKKGAYKAPLKGVERFTCRRRSRKVLSFVKRVYALLSCEGQKHFLESLDFDQGGSGQGH